MESRYTYLGSVLLPAVLISHQDQRLVALRQLIAGGEWGEVPTDLVSFLLACT